jgi:hypothetical protein
MAADRTFESPMNATLEGRFRRLEEDRLQLVQTLMRQPASVLDHRNRPEKWSIGEILMHLLTAERMTIEYMRKKSLGIQQLRNSGLLESVKTGLLILSQRLPLRYRAPEGVRKQTPDVIPLAALSREWQVARQRLKEVLDNIDDHNLHKLIYRHPVVGLLDANQCLIFMRAHFLHHLPQITRLL